MKKKIICMVCVDALKVGTWKQAEALASKWIGQFEKKPIQLPIWCRWMPPKLFVTLPGFLKNMAVKSLSSHLSDLIIAAGRQAVLVALALRHQVKTVVLMNPGVSPSYFDAVIAPVHDQLKGENVINTQGAIHGIDPDELEFPKYLEKYTYPRIGVLLGGNSVHGVYEKSLAIKMANDLRKFAVAQGASLIITPSRRTPIEWLEDFESVLEGLSYWIWDQKTANPYPNFLKGVDAIVVCEDSISMASEACVMGKPVLIYPTGITKPKFKRFYQQLFSNSYAQPFTRGAKLTIPPVLKELDRVVDRLKKIIVL
jgi:mitochondrial fission protein ELM1